MKSSAIKVGARTYSIATVDEQTFDAVLHQRGVDDPDVKSFVDYDDQVILVRDRLTREHRRELVLHELIHACIEDAGLNDESTERFVSVLAPRLNQLIEGLNVVLDEAT